MLRRRVVENVDRPVVQHPLDQPHDGQREVAVVGRRHQQTASLAKRLQRWLVVGVIAVRDHRSCLIPGLASEAYDHRQLRKLPEIVFSKRYARSLAGDLHGPILCWRQLQIKQFLDYWYPLFISAEEWVEQAGCAGDQACFHFVAAGCRAERSPEICLAICRALMDKGASADELKMAD